MLDPTARIAELLKPEHKPGSMVAIFQTAAPPILVAAATSATTRIAHRKSLLRCGDTLSPNHFPVMWKRELSQKSLRSAFADYRFCL